MTRKTCIINVFLLILLFPATDAVRLWGCLGLRAFWDGSEYYCYFKCWSFWYNTRNGVSRLKNDWVMGVYAVDLKNVTISQLGNIVPCYYHQTSHSSPIWNNRSSSRRRSSRFGIIGVVVVGGVAGIRNCNNRGILCLSRSGQKCILFLSSSCNVV